MKSPSMRSLMDSIRGHEPYLRPANDHRQRIAERKANNTEAHALLAIIDAEFTSDPHSVQCFDLRIVERVRRCVELRKQQERIL